MFSVLKSVLKEGEDIQDATEATFSLFGSQTFSMEHMVDFFAWPKKRHSSDCVRYLSTIFQYFDSFLVESLSKIYL